MNNIRWVILSFLVLLSGCSLQPSVEVADQVQVEITPGQFVDLPLPMQLQKEINVSQLISAQWAEENKRQLLVQLQVDKQQVVLAGFSAWGVKLLSLSYVSDATGNKIETNVMTGLSETLPQPEQILFNVMLAIWPKNSWDGPLSLIGWRLQEDGLQRSLIDENGDVVVTIDYQHKDYLNGKITFKHQRLNYTVVIETK